MHKLRSPILLTNNIRISIDGNISSGKSTLVAALEKNITQQCNIQVKTIPEPLAKWTNAGGHNLLGLFYADTAKNGFLFQHYVQLTRLMDTVKDNLENGTDSEIKNGNTGKISLMERSLQNNRYCFVELAKRQGSLQAAEYSVLVEWYNWLEKHFDLSLDIIIYLRTAPNVVYERMKLRNRSEEAEVPLNYLQAVHETYEDWLVKGIYGVEDSNKNQKVIVIDANNPKDEVASDCVALVTEYLKHYGTAQ